MSVKYCFEHQYDDENQWKVEIIVPEATHYKDISGQFFRFLSSVYGYEITAKDVIDEDLSNS